MNIHRHVKDKNFILLWFGDSVSQGGSVLQTLATVIWFINNFDSGKPLSFVFMASWIPVIFISPFAGVLIDRLSKKKIIIFSDLIRGLISIILAFIIISDLTIHIKFLAFFGGNLVYGVCNSFFNPCINSAIPELLEKEKLLKQQSFIFSSRNVVIISGQLLAAGLYAVAGPFYCFAFNGFSFIFSAFTEIFLRFPKPEHKHEITLDIVKRDIKEGFQYVIRRKTIYLLIVCFGLMNLILYPITSINIYLIIKQEMGSLGDSLLLLSRLPCIEFSRENSLAVLKAVFSAVGVAASLLVGLILSIKKEDIRKNTRYLLYSPVTQGLILMLLGILVLPIFADFLSAMGIFSVFVFFFFTINFLSSLVNINFRVFIQRSVDEKLRGRVFSILSLFCTAMIPVGLSIFGLLSDFKPGGILIFISGLVFSLFSLLLLPLRSSMEESLINGVSSDPT